VLNLQWDSMQVVVRATSTLSTVALTYGNTPCAPTLGGVSLVAAQTTVHGFSLATAGTPVALTSRYGIAERRTLAELPSVFTVSVGKVTMATIRSSAAVQQAGKVGVLLQWKITPAAGYLRAASATRVIYARLVQRYLVSLLARAQSDYASALAAEHVAVSSKTPLASWWGLQVWARSASKRLMSLQISESGPRPTIAYSAIGVPGVVGTVTAGTAVGVLRNLLDHAA
jgi:hypothetical protein